MPGRLLFVVLALAATVGLWMAGTPRPPVRSTVLTPREHEVCRLVVDSLANKEIAARLVMSVKQVKWLLTRIFDKTDTTNRTALAVHYYQRYIMGAGDDRLDQWVIYG